MHSASTLGAASPADIRPPFTVQPVLARNQIRLAIAGFWDADTIRAFSMALEDAVFELGTGRGQYTMCCDITHVAIQSQEVVRAFGELIVAGVPRARKLALWTGAALPRMQARRLAGLRDNLRIFDSEAEAQRWLAQP